MKSNNTSYTFLMLSQKEILIIFQTWERPDVYLKDLVSDLRKSVSDAELYFDFLINNGLNDRFYFANFENGALNVKTFRKINISNEYLKIADNYFARHWEIVENKSVLTNFQKVFFKKKLALNTSSEPNNKSFKKM